MTPTAPPHACGNRACGRLAPRGERYCPECRTQRDQAYNAARGSSTDQGYGATWRRLRLLILARDPVCRRCHRNPSTEVDHIVAKKDGGTNDEQNLQGLCKPCHSQKTALEDKRWGGRGQSLRT